MEAGAVGEHKQALRGELRAALRAISTGGLRHERSELIAAQLVVLVDRRREATAGGAPITVMVFRSLPSEPDLAGFADWCRAAGMTVVAPHVVGDTLEPEGYASGHSVASVDGASVAGVDGASVDVTSVASDGAVDVAVGDLDVVVVPGLAFTPDGRRLGRGGGHFDRFLPRLRPGCLTVGVCFTEQLRDDLPTEPHDIAVDLVVSA